MDEFAAERRTFLTPARILAGSLIGGAGIALLGFFWGGASASAAEPAPPPPPPAHSLIGAVGSLVSGVDGAVSGVVGEVGGAVGAVVQPVEAVVPAPVQETVATVTTPVTDALDDVADSSPVTHVVAPVTTAVDTVVTAVPLTHDLLGDDPVGTVVTPVTQAVDHTVGAVVDLTTDAIDPVAGQPSGGPATHETPASSDRDVVALRAATVMQQQLSVLSAGALGQVSTGAAATAAHPVLGSSEASPGAPPAPAPDGRAPIDSPAVAGSGASAAAAGAAGASAAVSDDLSTLFSAALGARSPALDDRLPSSPVADHDISPD